MNLLILLMIAVAFYGLVVALARRAEKEEAPHRYATDAEVSSSAKRMMAKHRKSLERLK